MVDIATKCAEINSIIDSTYNIVQYVEKDVHVINLYTKTTPPILVANIQWYEFLAETHIFYVENYLRDNPEHTGIGRQLIRKVACIAAKNHNRVTFTAASGKGPEYAPKLYAFYNSIGAKRNGEIIEPGSALERLRYNTPAENLIR